MSTDPTPEEHVDTAEEDGGDDEVVGHRNVPAESGTPPPRWA
jgi:hypothetical protein